MKILPLLFACAIPLAQAATETVTDTTHIAEKPLSELSSAQHWGLTPEEWTRYEQLKRGERGIWSPDLDPLTTLGVEAATDAERRKYADLLVEKEFQRVEKELAFQRAYDAAWKRRFPDVLPVAAASLPTAHEDSRLAVFVSENCPACDTRLSILLQSGHPLDLYLVDSNNDDARLRRWAVSKRIDITRVKRREITLNHDGGRWLQNGQGKMPAVLERRGDAWLPVTTP
ncbi:TIGR03759 family integrating conjugative element protein [Brenneria tiliae]|uniref:TIGR03759 family integrating conjugative element protein n=1 Tax=Brenneria tiliae TaxID=2914984 RepID=UPI002014E21E|nr:TIGR03759 family integrating conjugative element protein [Brenneria tiliae]MCL2897157.1 TIGR03759 family integrating conjugative element protein [Brenneria tiliae]MCL2904810.1 TIGR03759 family integrating conjugative element protein [Brenneria tiliae]